MNWNWMYPIALLVIMFLAAFIFLPWLQEKRGKNLCQRIANALLPPEDSPDLIKELTLAQLAKAAQCAPGDMLQPLTWLKKNGFIEERAIPRNPSVFKLTLVGRSWIRPPQKKPATAEEEEETFSSTENYGKKAKPVA